MGRLPSVIRHRDLDDIVGKTPTAILIGSYGSTFILMDDGTLWAPVIFRQIGENTPERLEDYRVDLRISNIPRLLDHPIKEQASRSDYKRKYNWLQYWGDIELYNEQDVKEPDEDGDTSYDRDQCFCMWFHEQEEAYDWLDDEVQYIRAMFVGWEVLDPMLHEKEINDIYASCTFHYKDIKRK